MMLLFCCSISPVSLHDCGYFTAYPRAVNQTAFVTGSSRPHLVVDQAVSLRGINEKGGKLIYCLFCKNSNQYRNSDIRTFNIDGWCA